MEFRFVRVDVFTDKVFGGNGLAVFPEGHTVPPDLMLPLAKEMNLAETTFVLPAEDEADVAQIRIFTPGTELPFAGHPTIGTTYVLAVEGRATTAEFSLQEKVGRVPVRVEGPLNRPGKIWMDQPLPTFSDPFLDRPAIAARLGIREADLLDAPIRTGSSGVPFVFIGLKEPNVVDHVSLADRDLSRFGESQGVFIYAPIGDGSNDVRSRMLGSHGLGIVEDPGTGGASGPLGALLVREGIVPAGETVELTSRQGYAMGRPSDISIRLRYATGGELSRVEVGGYVVGVMAGTVTV